MSDEFYPLQVDPRAQALSFMPSPFRSERSAAMLWAITDPLDGIDLSLADVAYQSSPDTAGTWMLESIGARYGEARGGLDLEEYRRIVKARVIADTARGRRDDLWAVWSALIGSSGDNLSVRRLQISGSPCVRFKARVLAMPGKPWRERAANVLRIAVAEGVECFGVLYVADAVTLGVAPGLGLDSGRLSALLQPSGI